ncbi:conserved hypothetical protein (plasmid) [Candidatus Protochlamydia naegleriophila]|uniref:Uncharacterized protein n=1 Tax=Candidatus Protochlamydia naegleriophila TaxID=389348 RepID=A0A0U5JH08_9BACT|nr:hypothetical protein [Candidatus Protochlamydia naegleriophila]CUI18170.1 conserved hypothetical protein [Candidatus Protochlamydia naegleriophila]
MEKTSRINFNLPSNIHICLKKCAIDQGMSVTELATIAIREKLEALEYEQDCRDAKAAHERFVKNGSKTISHEEMMKRLGWDDVDVQD